MESQPQNPEFRNNPENFTHVFDGPGCKFEVCYSIEFNA